MAVTMAMAVVGAAATVSMVPAVRTGAMVLVRLVMAGGALRRGGG
jgi:hypothetical protein